MAEPFEAIELDSLFCNYPRRIPRKVIIMAVTLEGMGSNSTPHSSSVSDATIIDTDVHTAYRTEEIRDAIASRLDEPYRSYLTTETLNYGPYPRDSFPKGQTKTSGSSMTEDAVVSDPEEIKSDLCEGLGIDIALLNSLQKFDLVPQTERAVNEMKAVNETFLEMFLEGHDEFYGYCMLSTRRPEAAAEEIDKWGSEESFVGAMILNGPSEKPLGDPRYDTIYRAAEDNDMPIVFHASAVGYSLNRKFPFLYQDLERYASLHALSHPFANMTTLTSLTMNGVFEKFPELTAIFLEQDLGIVPLLLPRLNREAAQHPYEVPLLEKTPEEYIRDQCYFATQPIPEPNDIEDARRVIDIVGPERILYASDHPHGDFDPPSAVINKYFGHLDRDQQEAILYRNAAEAFDISVS